jgi:hypothetical protein
MDPEAPVVTHRTLSFVLPGSRWRVILSAHRDSSGRLTSGACDSESAHRISA